MEYDTDTPLKLELKLNLITAQLDIILEQVTSGRKTLTDVDRMVIRRMNAHLQWLLDEINRGVD